MLRDQSYTYSTGTSLFASWEEVVQVIVSYVDYYLPDFVTYYKYQGCPSAENRITDLLSFHLNTCNQGYMPFYFGKNPTQNNGYRETDLGVYVKDRNMNPILPIFEFEAKKLSQTSNNKEYVCGKRGGIERFKRNIHSTHLPYCGMLGYVFNNDSNYWMGKINSWITSLASQSLSNGIDWRGNNELLHYIGTNGNITKSMSKNKRIVKTDIVIFHYLIDLT